MKSRSLINTFQLLLGFMIFIGFDQTYAQTKPAMSTMAAPGDGVTLRIIRTPSTMLAGQPFNVRWETTNALSVSFSCTSPSGGFAGSATLGTVNGSSGSTADLSWLGRDSNCVWTAEGDTEVVNVYETMRTVAAPNNAQFQSQNVPTQMVPGQTYPITIVFRNNSTASWTELGAYRLGTQNPEDNATWGINRVSTESVAPGNVKTFTFNVTAPSTPGRYNFQWRMVQEGVQWFGDYTPNVAIDVAAVSSPAQLNFTNCSSNSPSTAPNAAVLTCTLSNVGQSATNSISYANSSLNGMTVDGPVGYCGAGAVCGTVRVTSNTTAGNYSGTLTASPTAAGGINASTSVNLQVSVGIAPPTISVVRSTPIKADQSFTTTWSTNGDSLSYSCTANGGGFNGGGYVPVNGNENKIAQVAWVGNPSTCRWRAVGAGGVTEYVDYIVTEAPDVPVLNLSIISPSGPPNTSTQATVAIGQQFTLRWNLTGVASATLGCTDGVVSFDRAPVGIQGERSFTARAEWATPQGIGCSVTGNKANGDVVSSSMVYITVPAPPPAAPTINIVRTPLIAGESFTTSWSTTNATSLSYSCTASGTGFNGSANLAINGSEGGTALAGWVNYPSTCKWTATGPGGVTEVINSMVTGPNPYSPPVVTIISPSTPPDTSTQATVAIGQQFTLRWSMAGVTNATLGCTDGVVSYDRAPVAMQGERSFTARAEWATAQGIGCSVTGNKANGDVVSSSMVYIAVLAKPTIDIVQTPLIAEENFTTSWTTTNATSVSYSCTASGTGFNGSANIAINGNESGKALAAWLNYPSTCKWTATGPGGVTEVIKTMVTQPNSNTYIPPVVTIISPSAPPNTGTQATVAIGQQFTLRWSMAGVTNATLGCTDGVVNYDRAPVAMQGERSFTARAEWATAQGIGCSVTGNKANGDVVSSSMVYIAVLTKPTIDIVQTPLIAGENFTTSWTTTNATSVSYSCTASGTGFNGSANLTINGNEGGTALAAWLNYPSTCKWTATGPGGVTEVIKTMVTQPNSNTYIPPVV